MAQDVEDNADPKPSMDARAWLDTYGDEIENAMYPDGDAPEEFMVRPLARRHDRMVLKIVTNDRIATLKAFDREGRMARARTDRELALQLALKDTDLIPRIQAYSQESNWVLTDWVDGKLLEHELKEANACDYAQQLGTWFAGYTEVMEQHGGSKPTDWFSYLQAYTNNAARLDFSEYQSQLEKLRIQTRLIAKNDAFFGNFLVADDGRLVGIDFEKSQLKPYGWDILVTARILVRKFPDLLFPVTEAIVDGWDQGTDCMGKEDFLELTRIFVANTAFILEQDLAVRMQQANSIP